MSTKTAVIVLVAAAVLGVILYMVWGGPDQVLGKDIEVTVYTSGGESTGKAMVTVPFLKTLKDPAVIDIYVDRNGDEAFSEDERAVSGFSVRTKENWQNSFPIPVEGVPETVALEVVLNGKERVGVTVSPPHTYDIGALFDFGSVTNPEESMKGWGTAVIAADPATEAGRPNTGDLSQRPAECAPTSAANSIMSLAEENGMSLSDLPSPTEIVDGLKGDMGWTPAEGVLPDNFVQGKNEWAVKHNLPIRTEKVGDRNGASTLEQVLDAMANSAAAEVRLRFSQGTRVAGGHMVTVTGVRTSGGQTFIDVSDPATPAGTETYEVNGNIVEGYPSEFLVTLSWGFVQRWETPPSTDLEPLTDEEVRGIREAVGDRPTIKVIIVQGKKVPIAQVHVYDGRGSNDTCQAPHYHANAGSVTALDGTVIPDPGGCGYGKVAEVPVEEVAAP
jgi:hypothetical protein